LKSPIYNFFRETKNYIEYMYELRMPKSWLLTDLKYKYCVFHAKKELVWEFYYCHNNYFHGFHNRTLRLPEKRDKEKGRFNMNFI